MVSKEKGRFAHYVPRFYPHLTLEELYKLGNSHKALRESDVYINAVLQKLDPNCDFEIYPDVK